MTETIQPGDGRHDSVCPLDCADTCSLSIRVDQGQIVDVRGSQANPFTRGKLCAKVTRSLAEQVQGPARILTPLRRVRPGVEGDAFAPIGWDDALTLIHERFSAIIEEHGAQAIAPLSYGGPMGLLAGASMDKRFFHRLGATRVDSSTLCAGTSGAAWEALFGDVGGIDYEELALSRLILVWGNNITTCNLHLTTLIREAQKRGAKLVVVDPKRTRIARDADLHIPLLPGTDVVLAYAVANRLREIGGLDDAFIAEHVHGAGAFLEHAREFSGERAAALCGIDRALIEALATLFATVRPAAMSLGVAPERNRNGSAGVRAALSLLALTGNIGPRGAGPCDVSGFFPLDRDALARPDLAPPGVREINVLDIPRRILEPRPEDGAPPIKALFVYNHNPVAVHPQQGRMREALLSPDVFVVGSDLSMTDSMACADLILPASSHLEYADLYKAYGHRYLQRSRAVLPPQGEGLANTELFRRLAARFGFMENCFRDSDEDLIVQALPSRHAELASLTIEGPVDMAPYADDSLLRGRLPSTPSGRIELYSESLHESCGAGLPAYKPLPGAREFILVTPASEDRINSTFGGIDAQNRDVRCEIHPRDAARHGIGEGDPVVLINDQAEVFLPATLSDAVREGTLYVPKGAWLAERSAGATVNALIPGHQEDLIGGACYYDCAVDLRRAGRAS